MKPWHVTLGAVLVCAFLAYRVTALQSQVDALAKQLGDTDTPPPAVDKAPVVIDHGDRIEELEDDVRSLQDEVSLLSDRTAAKVDVNEVDDSVSEDRILSVVTQEAERIRDRQFAYQRERLLEFRDKAISDFAEQYNLTPNQEAQIQHLARTEVDSMFRVLKSQDALENPEQATSDWVAILTETDRQVARLLNPEQLAIWTQARFVERRTLWPWLPEPLE